MEPRLCLPPFDPHGRPPQDQGFTPIWKPESSPLGDSPSSETNLNRHVLVAKKLRDVMKKTPSPLPPNPMPSITVTWTHFQTLKILNTFLPRAWCWSPASSDQKQKQLTLSELFPGASSPSTLTGWGTVVVLVTAEGTQGGIASSSCLVPAEVSSPA